MKKRILGIAAAFMLAIVPLTGCGGTDTAAQPESQTQQDGAESGDEGGSEGAAADAEYGIKVGHVLANTHPYQLGLEKFGELAAEKSGGKIKVDVFHSSTLGNERDMVEALQLGTQEMVLVSTAVLSSFTDSFLVFDLPFLLIQRKRREWYATAIWERKYSEVLKATDLRGSFSLKTVSGT